MKNLYPLLYLVCITYLASCNQNSLEPENHGKVVISDTKKEIIQDSLLSYILSFTKLDSDTSFLISEFQMISIIENTGIENYTVRLKSSAWVKDNTLEIICASDIDPYSTTAYRIICTDSTYKIKDESTSDLVKYKNESIKTTTTYFPIHLNKKHFNVSDTVVATFTIKWTTNNEGQLSYRYMKGKIRAIVRS